MLEHTLITATWNIIALANRLEHFRVLHGITSHWTAHRCIRFCARSVRMIGWFSNQHGYTQTVCIQCARCIIGLRRWNIRKMYRKTTADAKLTNEYIIIELCISVLMRRQFRVLRNTTQRLALKYLIS